MREWILGVVGGTCSSLAASLIVWSVTVSISTYRYPEAWVEALERMDAGEHLDPDHHSLPELPEGELPPVPEPPPGAPVMTDREVAELIHRAIVASSPMSPYLDLMQAQMHVESRFDCEAVSPVGAAGCAQMMPTTWRGRPERGREGVSQPIGCDGVSRHDLACAMVGHVSYMRTQRGYVKGADFDSMLASYNEGVGNFRKRQGACRRMPGCNPKVWKDNLERIDGLKSPRAEDETKRYVRSINAGVSLFEGKPVVDVGVSLSW